MDKGQSNRMDNDLNKELQLNDMVDGLAGSSEAPQDMMLASFMKRERRTFIIVTVCSILALILALVWEHTPMGNALGLSCAFARLLHLYCPGCGGTRACYLMMHMHPLKSLLYHPIVPFCALLLAEYYIGAIITLIKRNGKRYYYMRDWFCYIALAIVLGNFIIRNILLVGFHVDYIGDLLPYWN